MNQTVSSPPSNTQRIQQPGFRLPLSFKLPVIVIGSLIVSFLLFVYTGTQLAEQIIIDILSDELQEFAVSKAEVIESRLTTVKAVAIQLAAIAETEEDEVEEDESNYTQSNDDRLVAEFGDVAVTAYWNMD